LVDLGITSQKRKTFVFPVFLDWAKVVRPPTCRSPARPTTLLDPCGRNRVTNKELIGTQCIKNTCFQMSASVLLPVTAVFLDSLFYLKYEVGDYAIAALADKNLWQFDRFNIAIRKTQSQDAAVI
jgi:hypothetical protein